MEEQRREQRRHGQVPTGGEARHHQWGGAESKIVCMRTQRTVHAEDAQHRAWVRDLRSVVITNIDDDGLALPHPSVQEEVVGRLEVSDECPARHKEDCWPLGWRFAPRSGLAVAHSPRPCAATGLHHDDTPAGYAPLLVQDIASNGSPDQPDGDRPAKRGIDGLVGEHVRFPPTGPDLRRRCRWPASEVGDQRDRKRICSTDRQIRARHDTQGGQHRSHVCVHHALGGIENRVESPPEGGVRPRYTEVKHDSRGVHLARVDVMQPGLGNQLWI
mmetsp:Transcript_11854/g.36617  ORF Transcript_11854/g.36617 Transcript_11854/m.36617 type:complete len:273 (+) Transcript_11854:1377-2195(+)